MVRILDALLLPPMGCFVLAALGLALCRRRRRLGRALLLLAVLALVLLSTPLVGSLLLSSLQTALPLDLRQPLPSAEAIVVLSADTEREAPELDGPTLGPMALQRVRYAALLQRATGKPLLASGGDADPGLPAHAALMSDVLERELGATVRWRETASLTTRENAERSAALLRAEGVESVYLVTHAWHMPRAKAAFERTGLTVVPAPTAFRGFPPELPKGLVPRWTGLRDSALALHEWIGRLWYAMSS